MLVISKTFRDRVILSKFLTNAERHEAYMYTNKYLSIIDIFYCVNTSYLVDRCICPAPCRSRQTIEKNVLSWALAGTGSVLFIRQVAV